MNVEIDHLGIAVRSLEEATQFYGGLLGMAISCRETIETEHVHVALLPAGAVANSPRIELLEASDKESAIARFIEKRGPGLHHVALRVDNLSAMAERLREAGARVLQEPRIGAGGHRYIFVHPASSGGVLLELIQK
jgi:methylmalonyl-CoA epimerase